MVGAFTQASARGSAAVLGIAFVQNIYGNSGMTPLMIVSAVPLYNIYSVIILTFCANNQDHSDKAATIKRAFKNILTNPIILGIAAGVPFSLLNIELPPLVLKTVTNVAQTATPMALLAVGAGFEGRKAIKKLKPTMIATFIKLGGPTGHPIFHLPLPWLPRKCSGGHPHYGWFSDNGYLLHHGQKHGQ